MSFAASAAVLAFVAAPADAAAAPALPGLSAAPAPAAEQAAAPGPVIVIPPLEPQAPVAPAAPSGVEKPTAAPPPTPGTPANGDIVVSGRAATPADPLAQLNAKSYEVIQGVDRAIVGPVAKGYETGLPEPVRDGLGNFLKNLRESVVFVNYMLQLKPGKALRTVGRFAINSTLGLGGVIDVAKRKPFNLPRKLNGFEDTFACYGIGPGPYLFLPLIGPTTLRDVIGVTMGRAFVPLVAGEPFNKPYYAIPAATIDMLTTRVEMDADLKRIREESRDPYTATRDLYLKQRYLHLMELCPKRAAKAFKLPSSVKADLKAEGIPVAEPTRPPEAPAPPAPAPAPGSAVP